MRVYVASLGVLALTATLADFRQLRLGFRRNSFGDGTGIVPEP